MGKRFVMAAVFIAVLVFSFGAPEAFLFLQSQKAERSAGSAVPLPPETGIPEQETSAAPAKAGAIIGESTAPVFEEDLFERLGTDNDYPTRLEVPSIRLDTPIVNVGINEKGEMGVPSGETKNVGWYEGGTPPGEKGSAVLAAHVYAAFKKLHTANVGSDVYVTMASGKKLHFVIRESLLYPYTSDILPYYLFERDDQPRLNLITCTGRWLPSAGTYTQRIVLYATLVGETTL